jgi:prophage regulatory protein
MTHKTTIPETGFLRLPEVLKFIPVGKSTWWAGVKSGKYPKQVKLGKRTSAWRAEEIKALIDSFNA